MVDKLHKNTECLLFLFKNDSYFKRLFTSTDIAGQYIKENKRYFFNYNSLTNPNIKRTLINQDFYNIFNRPCVYIHEVMNKCQYNHEITYNNKVINNQYRWSESDMDFMNNYNMAYYYINRIIRTIENCHRIKANKGKRYLKDVKNINISIPYWYFPKIEKSEINKLYSVEELLFLYNNRRLVKLPS